MQIDGAPGVSAAAAQELERARLLVRQGRAAEAERAYRALLARENRCLPAAVALARLLSGAGRPGEAEAVVRPFAQGPHPSHEALSARAAALKQLDRKPESLADYQAAARLNNASGVAAHNVASGLGDAGRDEEAAAEAERAFALGLDAPETWLVYGRALQGLRRFEESEAAFRAALARRPGYGEALRDLSQLVWMRTGQAALALAPVEAALAGASGPAAAALASLKLRLLSNVAGDEAALDFAKAALALAPDDARLALETAQLSLRSDPAWSRDLIAAVLARRPRDLVALRALSHAELALGEAARAAAVAERLLAENPLDQEAAAALATAWRLTGDPRRDELCDYGRLVRPAFIDVPRGWASREAYLEDLRLALAEMHALSAHPIEQSVRGGTQTSQNLAQSMDPVIGAFFEAIEGPIRAYRDALGQGQDAFRARNGGGHRVLGAWSVRLRAGGFHLDHMHPQGWISSACYIETPRSIGEEGHAGWLRFGQPPIPTRPALEAEHFVRPEPGLLVLFPSYLWHGTVPFDGDEHRTTIAFDLISS